MHHPDRLDLEGIAREILDGSGLDEAPVSALAIARHLGLVPMPSNTTAVAPPVLLFDEALSEERQRIRVAHEIGHVLLARAGHDDRDERAAWHVGAALVMPARGLRADLARHQWDLAEIVPRYGVSWEAMARRLTSLVGCVVSVWDRGELARRWCSPWIRSPMVARRGTPGWEAQLAGECRELEAHLHPENLVAAYHVPSADGWGTRVVVVSGLEEWEARTRRSASPRPGWLEAAE